MGVVKTVWTNVTFFDDGSKHTTVLYKSGEVTATTMVKQIGEAQTVHAKVTNGHSERATVLKYHGEKRTELMTREFASTSGGSTKQKMYVEKDGRASSKEVENDLTGKVLQNKSSFI